jgi:hypothetical protein
MSYKSKTFLTNKSLQVRQHREKKKYTMPLLLIIQEMTLPAQ